MSFFLLVSDMSATRNASTPDNSMMCTCAPAQVMPLDDKRSDGQELEQQWSPYLSQSCQFRNPKPEDYAFSQSMQHSTENLPFHVFGHIFSFLPLQGSQAAAQVCTSWAHLVECAANEKYKVAQQYMEEGLLCMQTSTSPWESLSLFRRAMVTYPRLCMPYYWAAKALLILDDWVAAVEVLQQALRQQPSPVESLMLKACIRYVHNDDQHASELLEHAALLDPSNAAMDFELGFCYQGTGQPSKAIDCYTSALGLNYARSFVVLSNRAECFIQNGMLDKAMEDLAVSLQICPDSPLALRTRAHLYNAMGNPYAAYEDYTTIINTVKDAKVQSDAYCDRAFCYGNMDAADIEQAHVLNPADLKVVQFKAFVLVNNGNVHEAINFVTEWMAHNGSSQDRACELAFRGELYALLSDWDAAILDYQRAIEIEQASSADGVQHALACYLQRLEELNSKRSGN